MATSAGSAGSEGELPAVETAFSDALRAKIGRVKKDAPDADVPDDATEAPPLLRLGWRDMVRIGLADRRAFLFLAIVAPFFEQASQEFGQAIADAIEDKAAEVAALGTTIAATVLVATGLSALVLWPWAGPAEISALDASELAALLERGEAVVVDVRTPGEFAAPPAQPM